MTIRIVEPREREMWNLFVSDEFPPVGAFLQSWEWGDFKESLHGKVIRFAIEDREAWIGCFQLEIHSLPLGLKYGYAPRGPVIKKETWLDESRVAEIFVNIAGYLKENFSHLIFARFEPPYHKSLPCYATRPFRQPTQYLQPRFNQLVSIKEPIDLQALSSDIRHDIRSAERLGITIEHKETLSIDEAQAFEEMKAQTRARSGKNIFPSDEYFRNFAAIFKTQTLKSHEEPSLRFFVARNAEGTPVAINLNVLFADTLTYLYGASYSGSISKRAPAYLHYQTMNYAREHGYLYYDLGGVDDGLWQGLTYFKRQFGGQTLEYVGNVDIVMMPPLYELYVHAKKQGFSRTSK